MIFGYKPNINYSVATLLYTHIQNLAYTVKLDSIIRALPNNESNTLALASTNKTMKLPLSYSHAFLHALDGFTLIHSSF